ncbi:putative LRR receptor-like serine/threonine-protein kinase [Senna tora]|uniref:non-specific serine/threonine protein kinase n=1 Tax=Senna tora TaxID=362788 RepID=A0A834WIC7_9FABA|nr:putative LRR receptor-like serine/threonine-protein kinase [Senna tora]
MGNFPKCFGDSNARKQPSSTTTIEQLCQCHRFSFPQLQKLTHNFHQTRLIGQGAFGYVYRSSISINGRPKEIAIKRAKNSPQGMAQIENEILFSCQLHHPNLISLLGFCNEKEEKIAVYEFMPNGSLKHQLYNHPMILSSWKKRLEISIGAARGLHYLHTGAKRTVVHRDFKIGDVLLDEDWNPRITDLGLSLKGPKFSSKPKPIEAKLAGTLVYLAPEYMYEGRVSDKSDVHSFAAVLVELVCGKTPYEVAKEMGRDRDIYEDEDGDDSPFKNPGKYIKFIVERGNGEKIIDPNLVGKIGAECWKVYIDVVERCLNRDENERPGMGEVEVELERALELQEQAEANNDGNSDPRKQSSSSTTIEQLCHRFSFRHLQKSTHNFHESRLIGRGSFSEVYRASLSLDNGQTKEVAIKRVRPDSPEGVVLSFENEILLLCQLHHPNLIPLLGFCIDEKEMIVVYEYMPNGNLAHQLFTNVPDSPPPSWKRRLEIGMGAARGLHYLHAGVKRTIVHRDFKPTNILLDENWNPRISDFGLSFTGPKFSSDPKPIEADRIAGTLEYMAKEYAFFGEISDKSDVYSFGVVLVELVCGKSSRGVREEMEKEEGAYSLNVGKYMKEIVERGNGERIIDPNLVGKIGAECWKLYVDIVERCLDEDASERPGMGEVEVELERALELQEQDEANNEFVHHPKATSNSQQ